MRKIFFFVFIYFIPFYISAQALPDTTQKIITDRLNSSKQKEKPYLILISVDGFRHDYADKFGAKNILRLSKNGVRAEAMIPSYPTFTFPSHYTIITGMHPARHGLISNHFYDRSRKEYYSMRQPMKVKDGSWYGGIPLWTLAEQQQMLSACYYWAGSEADIAGTKPTYHYAYNEIIPIDKRIKNVRNWLELPDDKRPHLITFYFPEVDQMGHRFGPDAVETGQAVQWVDSCIQWLVEEVNRTDLPVNFILLSDHGMTNLDKKNTIKFPAEFDQKKFIIPPGSEIIHLFAKQQDYIPAAYQLLSDHAEDYDIYLREDLPENLYPVTETALNRFGDIVLISHWPKVFNITSRNPNPGGHGFDPYKVPDMQAVFYAWGPHFKSGMTIPSFESVHVYPIVTSILGLRYSHIIDGNSSIAEQILK